MGGLRSRVVWGIAAVAAMGAVAMASAAEPTGPAPERADRASVELLETSQSKLLETRRIPESIDVPRRWKVRTHARIRADRDGARAARISKRVERVVKPDRDRLRLRMNKRGQRRLRRCGVEQTLIVQVRVLRSGRKRDRNQRLRDRRSLDVDLAACDGGSNPSPDPAPDPGPDPAPDPDPDPGPDPDPNPDPSPGPDPGTDPLAYALSPETAARHTNGTDRAYTAASLGGDAVRVTLFACDNVSAAGAGFEFAAAGDGSADPGSTGGSISSVEGVATSGSPRSIGPRTGPGGELDFEVVGSSTCAEPVAFNDADDDGKLDLKPDGTPAERYGVGGEVRFEAQGVNVANAERCDFLDTSDCLHPFPNDRFTAADAGTPTGKRVAFNPLSMPSNRFAVPILPTDHNRADGFSPGSMLITKVPGVSSEAALTQTGAVPIDDMGQWDDPEQPIVVIDADTGERHPVWAEVDANPADPADRALLVRPQRNWLEGHRYIVAMRNLKDAAGDPIPAGRAFELYREPVITSDAAVEERRPAMEELFSKLDAAGVERGDLNLAWDFTVASADSLAGRALAIRDDAFAGLGDTNLADLTVQGSSPTFSITNVEDRTAAEDSEIGRRVEGTVTAPCYINTPACAPGGQFIIDPLSGDPVQLPGNTVALQFICNIPQTALAPGAEPARPSLYGHGLLGSAGEVDAGNVERMANEHNMIMCATDWAGFSTKDIATIGVILQDLNNFPKLVDHSQQGFLNFMFLGRALIHGAGLGTDAAFQDAGGESLIDTDRLFYDGNSQGGILGGSLVALSPDVDRGVLGVPGMNYSTLLRRSVDFAPYAEGTFFGGIDTGLGLYDNYPDELQRPLILSLMQMLWDRGENNGYAEHFGDNPLPNSPPSEVLLHPAFADHQVANVSAEVMARTIGAPTNSPLDPGRFPGADPLFDIPVIDSYPYDGSAIVYWDSGTPNAPGQNVPPEDGDDPHGHPRNDPAARQQKSDFLQIDGKVTDVCGGGPCYANGYLPPP